MIENRGIWTDLIKGVGLEIAEVFDQGQEEYLPGLESVISKETGDGAEANYTGKTGAGQAKKFDDGDDVPLSRRYKTYTTKVRWTNYGLGVQVTKNQIEDRDFASELAEMKDLSIGVNFSQDKSAMQLFNGGFATTVSVNGYDMTWYGDAKPLFSTIHPTTVPGGSTQSNASSTGIVFNGDNLETGMMALMEQATDDGLPLALMGKPTMVLPDALQKEGLEITKSELQPNSANNTINVYKNGMAADMVVSLHLGSTFGGSNTAWYLTVPQRNKLSHIVRQEAQLNQGVNDLNFVVTYTVNARWADAVKDWRRNWGSKGDLAAYSS